MNNQTFIEKKIILEFSFCMSLYSFIFLNESMPSYQKKKKKKKVSIVLVRDTRKNVCYLFFTISI